MGTSFSIGSTEPGSSVSKLSLSEESLDTHDGQELDLYNPDLFRAVVDRGDLVTTCDKSGQKTLESAEALERAAAALAEKTAGPTRRRKRDMLRSLLVG